MILSQIKCLRWGEYDGGDLISDEISEGGRVSMRGGSYLR